MARASYHTLLSLDRYAKIMGITPPYFNQGHGTSVFPLSGSCDGIWFQYAWQQFDQISREDLAQEMVNTEQDIANYLGYYPAPKWISKEIHPYPRPYRRDTYGFGLNVRWMSKSIETNYAKIISAGRRAVSSVNTGVAVVYSDPDGDGFNELATITTATTLTDVCEVKLYFAGHSGQQEWEIRPVKTKVISGGNVTFTVDSWLLLDPDLWEAYPDASGDVSAIDIETGGNFVTTVDVYREYTDFTQASTEFSWEPITDVALITFCTSCGGSGCAVCTNTTQNGCLHIRDVDRGIVVPTPATYDSDNSQWTKADWTECREPDTAKVWYYAGDLDQKYLRGDSCEPLSDYFAQIIAYMTTARLARPFCGCDNVRNRTARLQMDLAFSEPDGGTFFTNDEILNNPFGTKFGEVWAWKRLYQLVDRVPDVALV